MKNIEELEKIAVLIDADNAQLSKLKLILDEISTNGRIVVKKAYGNWKSALLKKWEDDLNLLAIKPEQQFAYTVGKNATDIAMVIDAMDLLNTGAYDAFVLVSSDSDFTPLAIRLKESGVYVFGVGEEKTPQSFRNACDDFILTEYLVEASPEKEIKVVTETEVNKPKSSSKPDRPNMDNVHRMLKMAYDKYRDADGLVNVSAVGSYLKRVKPDFNPRMYGFSKLPDLLDNFPKRYETKRYKGKGTVTIIAYKCL